MDKKEQPGAVISPGSKEPEANWQFKSGPESESSKKLAEPMPQHMESPQTISEVPDVNWSASEFISHDKSAFWYLILTFGTAAIAVVVFLATRDFVATGAVVVACASFGILAARKPRELQYSVDNSGVHVGEKFYAYSGFRSFSIVQEDALQSIWLMPLKRFMPPLTLYFDPNDGERIVDVLAGFLPLENRQLDPVDKLMHRLRF